MNGLFQKKRKKREEEKRKQRIGKGGNSVVLISGYRDTQRNCGRLVFFSVCFVWGCVLKMFQMERSMDF